MKKIFTLFTIVLLSINSFGQGDSIKGTIYSFVPQYLINRGIRVDLEKQIASNHLLQICPQFYLADKKEGSDFLHEENSFNYLIGGGLSLYDKIFAFDDFKKYGLYLSYGATYNFFHIEYIDNPGSNPISATAKIHKVGGDLIIGYQVFIREIVSLDFYTGVGIRYSNMDTNGTDMNRFNTGYYGYNYTGNIMLLGFRIGVIL